MPSSTPKHFHASDAYQLVRGEWRFEVASTARWAFPATAQAPILARRAVERHLRRSSAAEELRQVRLLVSELVTNAVVHGPRGAQIVVRLAAARPRIRVEVADEGAGFELVWPPAVRPDGSMGYGLVLVDHLAARWGVSGRHGTCVWFELERQATAA